MKSKHHKIVLSISTLAIAIATSFSNAAETSYKASSVNQPIKIVNIASLEAQANPADCLGKCLCDKS